MVNMWRLYAQWNKPCLHVILIGDKEKEALKFKLSNGPVPVFLVSEVDSWNRFQIEIYYIYVSSRNFVDKVSVNSRSTSLKQQAYIYRYIFLWSGTEGMLVLKPNLKESVCHHLSFICTRNTIGIEITPLSIFELKQSSQVSSTSMAQFQACLL